MLEVYITDWCPVCGRVTGRLKENSIPFTSADIEQQPAEIQERVIQASGGNSWRVPTFEYDGTWLAAASFNPERLKRQRTAMGALQTESAGKKSVRRTGK